jgi:hypothetical protein
MGLNHRPLHYEWKDRKLETPAQQAFLSLCFYGARILHTFRNACPERLPLQSPPGAPGAENPFLRKGFPKRVDENSTFSDLDRAVPPPGADDPAPKETP